MGKPKVQSKSEVASLKELRDKNEEMLHQSHADDTLGEAHEESELASQPVLSEEDQRLMALMNRLVQLAEPTMEKDIATYRLRKVWELSNVIMPRLMARLEQSSGDESQS